MENSPESTSSSPRLSSRSSEVELHTPSSEGTSLTGSIFQELWHHNVEFIAVVGGLGYIGSHTCLELLKAGYNIIIIDNLSNSFREVYGRINELTKQHYEKKCQPAPLMYFHEADYRDGDAIREILKEFARESENDFSKEPSESRIKGVIHFAAYKSVPESIHQPLKYYANNVAGLVEFCLLLNEYGIKTLIFSSSAAVYGDNANSGLPLMEEYCAHRTEVFADHDGTEKTVLNGCKGITNPYARSKWMCEAILSDLAVADPEWTIVALRYFNPVGCDESGLLGEDPRTTPTNLMPVVLRVITGLSPALEVFGTDYPTHDGTAVRDFIHVSDLACGHIAALAATQNGRISGGFRVYNLGSGNGHSVFDIVNAMESVSSSKITIHTVNRREGDVGVCVALPRKAELELNWKTQKSLTTSCRDIWNHLNKRNTSEPGSGGACLLFK